MRKNADGTHVLRGISCASVSSCAVIDATGYVATYTAPTSELTWSEGGSLPLVLADGTDDYVYGPGDAPVEQVNVTSSAPTDNPVFLTYTPSDSSWVVTTTTGQELSFYGYDAFGNLAFGTPLSAFGYAGQYSGTTSNPNGLVDMRARWYEPQTGAFTTRDPDFAATDEAYAYADGDPVNSSDPTGMAEITGGEGGTAPTTVDSLLNEVTALQAELWAEEPVGCAEEVSDSAEIDGGLIDGTPCAGLGQAGYDSATHGVTFAPLSGSDSAAAISCTAGRCLVLGVADSLCLDGHLTSLYTVSTSGYKQWMTAVAVIGASGAASGVPQGLTTEQAAAAVQLIRDSASGIRGEVGVQGSRANYTAGQTPISTLEFV